MRQRYRSVILIITIAIVTAGVITRLQRPDAIPVVLATVEQGAVEATVVNTRAGTVKACRRTHLAPAIGGQVARLHVREGDNVAAGQLLLELWNDDLKAELRLAQDQAVAVRSRGEETCYRAEAADREAKRKLELQKKQLAAEEEVDRAVTLAKAQQAACLAAQSDVLVSDARIAHRRAILERTVLLAPFAGRVAEVNAEVGEFVTPSPQGIATLPPIDLMDTSCLYVSAPIDEVDAPMIEIGMKTRITLDAYRGTTFPGEVTRIAPYVLEREKQARTVAVEATFEEEGAPDTLLPGYSADLEVVLATQRDVVRAPTEAILDQSRVFVFNKEAGTLEERKIDIGLSNWQTTEVREGLSPGEWVVTSVDRAGVKDGAHAKPDEASNVASD